MYIYIYIYAERNDDDVEAIFIEYIILSREKNYIIVTYAIFFTLSNKH